MPESSRPYRLAERHGPAGRLVLQQSDDDGSRLIVCSGYEGPELPASISDPELAQGTGGRWSLHCREGSFEFRARAVQQIEERPSLYEPLHRAFALSTGDRLAARLLLALLRMPGGARLMRFWHSHRA
jgi:hypothetical protein